MEQFRSRHYLVAPTLSLLWQRHTPGCGAPDNTQEARKHTLSLGLPRWHAYKRTRRPTEVSARQVFGLSKPFQESQRADSNR
jgi:hypothetical protein